MKHILFLLSLTFSLSYSAQECNCPQSFEWVINTFETNDAGFKYVTDKKGIEDYKKYTNLYKDKVKNITNQKECEKIMTDWLHYFRSGHIYVSAKQQENNVNGKPLSDAEIREKYKNEKTINLTQKQFIADLEKRKDRHPLEGIWKNGNYIIGIIKDKNNSLKFTGFIIKADSTYWMPKQIKAEFTLKADSSFDVNYYMRDHSKEITSAQFISKSYNVLKLFNNYWERSYPNVVPDKKEEVLLAFSNSPKPFIKKLSDKTIYLRIPSFLHEQKKYIDSVLATNDKLITSTENLIIDIRYGTGGADAAYEEIMAYLYTNPMRGVGVKLYATELNALAYEGYAKEYTDTADINRLNGIAKNMRANIGKFITTSDQHYYTTSYDTVMPYPKKVGIICNHNNGSTDEQFLIDAKQSRKVKVFGIPTGGMLDVSNMNDIDSPDHNFTLGYCMSLSFRIPNYCIDGIGIQPDYFIDDDISEYDWIDYTKTVLEQ